MDSSGYTNSANRIGTIEAGPGQQVVATVASPNDKQRCDPQHFVRVEETVTLTLRNLEPHTAASVPFDLYVLKRWDGKNPTMGPTERASVSVQGGRTLLDTTFSTVRKPALTI